MEFVQMLRKAAQDKADKDGTEPGKTLYWDAANVFLGNKDAHGIHDMGVEIQALQRAINELEKLIDA
jgi:hypothetical protein